MQGRRRQIRTEIGSPERAAGGTGRDERRRRAAAVYCRYFDCVLAGGQAVVVFHDAVRGGWFAQKA
jgi:hypothetical protein